MKFFNSWGFLATHNLLRLASWFEKKDIEPESLKVWQLAKLRQLEDERDKLKSNLSQIDYEIDLILRNEVRDRFWVTLKPEVLKDLRTPKTKEGCIHRKGTGKVGCDLTVADYNVSVHTFINGRTRVRCNQCGDIRWDGEPGYDKFLEYAQDSTNHQSSSEVPQRLPTQRGATDAIDQKS